MLRRGPQHEERGGATKQQRERHQNGDGEEAPARWHARVASKLREMQPPRHARCVRGGNSATATLRHREREARIERFGSTG